MNISIINKNSKLIEASEGYKLSFRNSSSNKFFTRLKCSIDFDESNLLEVKKTNIEIKLPVIEKQFEENSNLDEIKQYIISQTKILLQEFLKKNPLLYKGKYYSVTSEAQNHLLNMIQAAENAEKLKISFTPTWNAIDEVRSFYSIDDLKKLSIEIQNYILPYIIQQQVMEQQILELLDKNDLLTFNIAYQKQQ